MKEENLTPYQICDHHDLTRQRCYLCYNDMFYNLQVEKIERSLHPIRVLLGILLGFITIIDIMIFPFPQIKTFIDPIFPYLALTSLVIIVINLILLLKQRKMVKKQLIILELMINLPEEC